MKTLLAALLALTPTLAAASGYEFEGVGAQEVSRAGAATASVDDWTAIYWNPAALTRATARGREEGLEVFGGKAYGYDSDSLSKLPGVGPIFKDDAIQSPFILGAAGAALPLGKRLALGFGAYTPLLQGFKFYDVAPNSSATELRASASAGIVTSNVSLAWKVLPQLSLGAGLDVLYGEIASDTVLTNPTGTLALYGSRIASHQRGQGAAPEGVVSLLWDATDALSLGSTFRTGADIRLRGDATASSPNAGAESSRFTFFLRHPPTWDVGLAWKSAPSMTLSVDLHQTYWHRFSNEFQYDKQGNLLKDSADSFQWHDAWKLRAGLDWRADAKDDFEVGYSHDTWAVDPGSVDITTTLDVDMNRFSGGWSRRWSRLVETTVGAIGGSGTRTGPGGVRWSVSGFQGMGEMRFHI
ncbi:MAG: outer membrane protein transport protein [Elusimicrobia bacterium]|nr:outer membrane protein transport protein [Elusimicrobiota bacterium]